LVDKTLVMRKLSELEEYLNQVREFSSITLQEYTDNWKTQRIIERTLQLMIELCTDIAGHLISSERLRVPTSYADTFKVLLEGNLIDPSLYQVMERMAKFNGLVKSHKSDGTVKSSRCKARESLGMRRTYRYAAVT